MANLENIQGNIATTPTGAKVDTTTGQLISNPTQLPPNNYNNVSITSDNLYSTPTPIVTPPITVPPPNVANLPITGNITTPSGAIVNATTGTLITSPPVSKSDYLQQLQDVENQLMGVNKTSEISANTQQQQRELQNINTQIRMHQADALAAQEKALNSGETLSFASGEAQRVAHNDAIEVIRLSALAQAAQGNLELATNLATRSVDEKYKQIEADLLTKRNNIINNYDFFTDAQKKQADALLLQLNAQDTFVAVNKKKEIDLQTIGNTAAANGAPLALVRQAIATGDTIKANVMLNQYVGTKANQILNNPIGTNNTPVIHTINGKSMTDAQALSYGYAQRLNDANKIISNLGSSFTGIFSYFGGSSFLPNFLKSSARQEFEQAQRNFINAILRKESGAAISPSEFASAAQQYFPQPGDSSATLEQKTANRERAIKNFAVAANVPLSEIGSEENKSGTYEDYLKSINQ